LSVGEAEADLSVPLQVFALALHIVSHPIVPHSSTPLLFWSLSSVILSAIALRTALIRAPPSSLPPLRLALFVFLTIKLSLFGVLFIVELFGPDGWDHLTARDLVSWLPGVSDQGRIRLDEQEAAMGASDDEWVQLECPRLRANIFSRLTFSWLTPM
jgi:ATP-binding cassette, subfamily C (CFTR/MRP), member 1